MTNNPIKPDHPIKLGGVHHAAYRCRDAKQTVEWYRDVLGMEYTSAFSEDHVPSTGAYDPYMHVFLDAGNGNILAFFELPNQKDMGRDENTPEWVQHLAFRWLLKRHCWRRKHISKGWISMSLARPITVFSSRSISSIQTVTVSNLAADIGTNEQYAELKKVAMPMLDEWSETKKAPRHADWLHDVARQENAAKA